VQNKDVLDGIRGILSGSPPAPRSCATPNASGRASAPSEPPPLYVTIVEADNVVIADTAGNSTAVFPRTTLAGTVPGVQEQILGDHARSIILSSATEYMATFNATTHPLNILISIGYGPAATQAIRYRDVVLPAGVAAQLHFTANGIDKLRYDTAGNGTFTTEVQPTSNVSGTSAQDVTPPVVSVSAVMQPATVVVTIQASDSGSGVRDLYYSLDGTRFVPYVRPLAVNPYETPTVVAFADDKAGNRSGAVKFPVPLLPIAKVSPTSLTFGSQGQHPGAPQTVVLTNISKVAMTISGISTTGDFAQTNDCGNSLAPGGSCMVSVTFSPKFGGVRRGELSLGHDGFGPLSIPLTGIGGTRP